MAKNGHFFAIFLTPKNVAKWLKMKGNALKRAFLLISGFFKHFTVEKKGSKIGQK